MVRMTQSMAQFLFKFHRDKLALIAMGHLELYTEEMDKEYFDWLKTDEGKSYLKGGSNYKEELNPKEKENPIEAFMSKQPCDKCLFQNTPNCKIFGIGVNGEMGCSFKERVRMSEIKEN